MKVIKSNLTGKDKHAVKVEDQLIIKLIGRLKDKSITIIYISTEYIRNAHTQ